MRQIRKVIRCEQQFIKKGHPLYDIVDRHCFYSKNVYNQANYLLRQEFTKNNNYLGATQLQKIMQSMDCYKECGSQAAQKTIQMVDKAWKSYFSAIKDWKKHPSKYLGMPKIPKYLNKNGRQVFALKNVQCSLKDGLFRISYKPFNQYTVRTHAQGKLMQCRFVPRGSHYVMEIVYEIEVPECNEQSERIAAIDIGVDNFITMVNNIGEQPIVVKGGVIKSINQYYNKQKAKLQAELKTTNKKDWSKRLQKLTDKRYEMIKYQMHCISKYVIDWCVLYNIDTLIVGHNDDWITEQQMYDFLIEAHTEKSKVFKKWLTEEVLPTIEKTGAYIEEGREQEMVNYYFSSLSSDLQEKIVNELIEKNKELQTFYDDLMNTEGVYSMNTTAKELRIGRNTLFAYLRGKSIMFYQDGANVPYQRFMNQGLFRVIESPCTDGQYRPTTYATKKGLDYIRKLLRKDGYYEEVA